MTTSVSLSADPILSFRDNNNLPLIGGQLLTQVGGVNYPAYSEQTGTVALPNPIILNGRGEVATSTGTSSPLFLAQNTTYTFTLFDSLGNVIWTNPSVLGIATVAGVLAALTQSALGGILYPTTPAETSAIVVNAAYAPVKFQYPPGNVFRYGAVGDGTTADDVPINAAICQCGQLNGNAVFFPATGSSTNAGYYAIYSTINITASLYMYGEMDRGSLKGPSIIQRTTGIQSFVVSGAAGSFSITCENLSFKSASATVVVGAAIWNLNSTSHLPNSYYFKNCWFQTPVYYAISASYCDDVQLLGCTFDITGFKWFAFGLNGAITNVSIVGCTFADNNNIGCCDVGDIDGMVVTGNRFYSNTANAPYAFNIQQYATTASKNIAITGNHFHGYNNVMQLGHLASQVTFTGNVVEGVGPIAGANYSAISFGGGTVVTGIVIVGNSIYGFSGSALGMIDAGSTPVQNCNISNNVIEANVGGSSSIYCINLSAASTSNNVIANNVYVGAIAIPVAIATFTNNGLILSGTFPFTTTGMGSASGTAEFSVNGNVASVFFPALNGAAGGSTTATIVGLPTYLFPTRTQNAYCIVTNSGTNVAGNASITNSATITLSVGPTFGAFAGTSTNGIQPFSLTYILN